jgi:hypothetical protein
MGTLATSLDSAAAKAPCSLMPRKDNRVIKCSVSFASNEPSGRVVAPMGTGARLPPSPLALEESSATPVLLTVPSGNGHRTALWVVARKGLIKRNAHNALCAPRVVLEAGQAVAPHPSTGILLFPGVHQKVISDALMKNGSQGRVCNRQAGNYHKSRKKKFAMTACVRLARAGQIVTVEVAKRWLLSKGREPFFAV